MPHINRIRVNNIKYNVGTQFYDDLCLRFQGKNSLYDLANGGGKSVLMLLLLQNLIPNCTLDDKQPVEKLFRGSTGSSVIHSLIEWDLDRPDQEECGFRFMTTGFCARKKADRIKEGEEEVSSSAIEYFNYCIFYNEFNDYDILNLPLVNGKERITFKGLKELIKRLQAESNRKLSVKIFENSKSEYQSFIAGHGLYESQWNIIRGINKTEGHVRTYFESNYRTSRKVVEDLLIEEIIQKAYQLQTGKEKDAEELAQTLLDIREQMVELSKKKEQISNYDRQITVIQEFLTKFEPLLQNFELCRENEQKTSVFYHTLLDERERIEAEAEQLEEALQNMQEQQQETERILLTLDLQELECHLDEANYEREQKEKQKEQLKEAVEELRQTVTEKESVQYFLNYAKAQSRAHTIEVEMERMKQGNEELYQSLLEMTAQKKRKDEQIFEQLNRQKDEAEKNRETSRREKEEADKKERESDNACAVLESRLIENEKERTALQKEIGEGMKAFPFLLREQIKDTIIEKEKEEDAERESKRTLEQECETIKEQLQSDRLMAKDLEHEAKELHTKEEECQAQLAIYEELTEKVAQRMEVYGEKDVYRLLELLKEKQRETIILLHDGQNRQSELQKQLEQLQKGILFQVTPEAEQLKEFLYRKYGDGVLGTELLEQMQGEKKEEVLGRIPYLPYSIVVGHRIYEKILAEPKPEEWQNVSWMIPVVDQTYLEHGQFDAGDGVMFAGKEAAYFLEKEQLEKEIHRTEEVLDLEHKKQEQLREQQKVLTADTDGVQEYVTNYFENYAGWLEEQQERKEKRAQVMEAQEQLKEKEKKLCARAAELERKIPESAAKIKKLAEEILSLQRLEDIFRKSDLVEANQREWKEKKAELELEKEALWRLVQAKEREISEADGRIRQITAQIMERKMGWERYAAYYKEEIPIQEPIPERLEEELDGAIAAFEKENKDVREKSETLQVIREQITSYLRELRSRKADVKMLEQLYEEQKLAEVSDEEIEAQKEHLMEEEKLLQRCEKKVSELVLACTRFQSQADVIAGQIRERFYRIERLPIAAGTIEIEKERQKELQQQCKRELAELFRKQKETGKAQEEIQTMIGKITWVVEEYHIKDMSVKTLPGFVILDWKETERQIMSGWQKMKARKTAAETAFGKAKAWCEETLTGLGAGSFALQMKEQIPVPQSFEEADKTIKRLEEACVMIQMGRDQIEESLRDIEKIKSSFENQCLQRCNTIRMELDKFPKLSSIMIDEKLTQIVRLKIPYVREEQQQMQISNYLGQVIENLEKYETEQEKKKYLIQELSMKRMFSAIVTDMNRISLELYKRERIKEQSRHLRYEEAVGSTGQSQGIYIQFLIAIINYIASIHSYHANEESLKKVIFIDNPFGAAKDTYIWEPIFAMLAANRVQLIVPTRGATPAIIGKFDVNYLLGQKMVGQKQQTVIVDYRSKIDVEEAEYVKMEYEQTTLF